MGNYAAGTAEGCMLLNLDPCRANYLFDPDGAAWVLDWSRACLLAWV